MKIERREMKESGVIQVTTVDERWYEHPDFPDKPFGSMTWIAGCYPKGLPFMKWLAEHGWDESQALKKAAGDKGSRVHKAIEVYTLGGILTMTDSFADGDGQLAEFTVEEWECCVAFHNWFTKLRSEHTVEVLSTEMTVFNFDLWYAGTQDLKLKIDDQVVIYDIKTGQNIWPEYEIQLTGYRHCKGNEDVTATRILQVGYRRNKAGWKESEIEDKWNLLLAAYEIWKEEHGGEKPRQKDYPVSLSFNHKEATNATHQ